ncbi:hypothetical protein RB195_016140 [Necator americanus]|uniref:Uncharacterized protein n=1 Tax=Necator americanus TaxID=51031 RepID=A0ABR1E7W5_NECAM
MQPFGEVECASHVAFLFPPEFPWHTVISGIAFPCFKRALICAILASISLFRKAPRWTVLDAFVPLDPLREYGLPPTCENPCHMYSSLSPY